MRTNFGLLRQLRLFYCHSSFLLTVKPPGLRSYIDKLNKELNEVKSNTTLPFCQKVSPKSAINSESITSSSEHHPKSAISGATHSDSERRTASFYPKPYQMKPNQTDRQYSPLSRRRTISNSRKLTVEEVERDRKIDETFVDSPPSKRFGSASTNASATTSGGKSRSSLRAEELLESEITLLRSKNKSMRLPQNQTTKTRDVVSTKSGSERPLKIDRPPKPEAEEDTFGLIGGTKMAGVGYSLYS